MNSIPVSQLVTINPGVLAAAGTQNNLNGLLLSQDASLPLNTLMSFGAAPAVGAYFGLASPEYQASLVYFNGPNNKTKTASILYFGRYANAVSAGFLRSASLAAMTLTQLQALTGTLTITAGGTPLTSATINLSAATSFSQAATLIQTGFTAPGFAVTYDAQRAAFLFTNTATGAASTQAYATGTLAAGLLLTQATGAVLSQGAIAQTPAGTMTVLAGLSQNWSGFAPVFEPVLADKQAFSTWVNGTNKSYVFYGQDSDIQAITPASTQSWGYWLGTTQPDGSVPIYGNSTHSAFALGWMAALDFTKKNGRQTLAFRGQSGLVPSVTDGPTALLLNANNYNFYGNYAAANQTFQVMYDGGISGLYNWTDSYVHQMWMRSNLTLAFMNLLTQVGTIPYNSAGYSQVDAAAQSPIQAAVNFGAIVPGVTLSASQISQITASVGFDVSSALFAQGYYLQITDAAPGTRAARSSPPIALYYCDGESIQAINMSAIEIQ
jgi:hypothetical protein